MSLPEELLQNQDVARKSQNVSRIAVELRKVDESVDTLRRSLPRAVAEDEQRRATAILENKAAPKGSKAATVREGIAEAEERSAATRRALASARDELHEVVGKHRVAALPPLRERHERARLAVLAEVGELSAKVDEHDRVFGELVWLESFPEDGRAIQWGAWLPAIRMPSGEPLTFSAAVSALRARFETVMGSGGDDEPRHVRTDDWDAAAEAEPELELSPSQVRSRNGVR
jgi:hypothetical protein